MDCRHLGGAKELFFARDYISGADFAVRLCGQCHLVYTDLAATEQMVLSDTFYPPDYYGKQKRYPYVLQKLLNFLVQQRARLLGHDARKAEGAVLDIGCGQGLFLKLFADRGWRAVGTEAGPTAAFHAQRVLGLDVLVGEWATRQLEAEAFDVVSIWHVLEHVVAPKALLGEARRVLKSDGTLLLSVPNFSSLEARITRWGWFHLDVPRHVTHFTAESLRATLDECGWVVTRRTFFTPEYDYFSFVQSAQNFCGLDPNLLYRMLRHGELRSGTTAKGSAIQKLLVILTVPLFAIVSVFYVPVANALRQGSCINIVAKKKSC